MEYYTPLIHHYWAEGGIEYLLVPSLPLQSHSSVSILRHCLPSREPAHLAVEGEGGRLR
jgi:hypothetical protein